MNAIVRLQKIVRLYRPSNGTEGQSFIQAHCMRCIRDRNGDCPILARTFAYSIEDPEYPREWITVDDGPMCTGYVPDEGQNPNAPTPRELEAAGQCRLF